MSHVHKILDSKSPIDRTIQYIKCTIYKDYSAEHFTNDANVKRAKAGGNSNAGGNANARSDEEQGGHGGRQIGTKSQTSSHFEADHM